MYEQDDTRRESFSGRSLDGSSTSERHEALGLRRGIACLLITVGFIGACWSIMTVYSAIRRPDTVPLYRDIAADAVARLNSDENTELIIPAKFLAALSTFLLLIISSSVSGTLIAQGVNLISFDTQRLVRKLNSLKLSVAEKFRAVKEALQRR
jgi:hypothetical protein